MVSVGDKKSGCGMNNQRPPREPALPLLVAGLLTLGAAFAVCGAFPGVRIVCEAKETGTVTAKKESAADAEEQEVIEFVTAYRNAFSPEGIDKLADYVDDPEESDAFLKEVWEISLSDEITDHSNEIAVAYNALLAEHPELVELLESMHMKIEEEVAEMLEEQLPVKVKAEGTDEEKSAAEKDTYTVKTGDCLWYIAEEQPGDGMRWGGLYEKNKDVIGENPDLLNVGITLQLD